jgi:CHAT domain-containing protein/Tfp pilus assembly protein PilF
MPKDTRRAGALMAHGKKAQQRGDYVTAQRRCEQALALRRRAYGDAHPKVAATLNGLGAVSSELGQQEVARGHHEAALAILRRALGEEHPDVAASLNGLGRVCLRLGNHPAARGYFEQALAIRRKAFGEEHPDVAASLNNLGIVSRDLGDYAAARGYHEQALAIRRQAFGEEHPDVAASLNNLGNVSANLGDYAAARGYHEQALAIRRRAFGGAHPDVAVSLNNLGVVSADLGDYAAARGYHEQSLAIRRRAFGEAHPLVASSLNNLAEVCRKEGDLERAGALLEEALAIALLPDNVVCLSQTYQGLSALNAALGASPAAIFFGKQAVNAIQRQRGALTTLDSELQRSFLATKERTYRELADLLVAAGRLGEAQQVLAMLKEEELFDLLRRDAANDPRLTFAQLTSPEAEWQRHGDEIGRDLVALTAEIAALRQQSERSEAEAVRLRAASGERDAAGRRFRAWLDALRTELAQSREQEERTAAINLELLEKLQGELRALGSDVALVSYIVGENRLSIILTTASLQVSRDAAVPERTVNRLVHELRLAIDKRLDDAEPLALTLYGHLIGPIAPLLDELGIATLMVVPYGTLRYLPFAALYDGERYLVERCALAILTLAAYSNIKDPPVAEWRVAGLGVSREVPGYRRLVAVVEELHGIIRTAATETGRSATQPISTIDRPITKTARVSTRRKRRMATTGVYPGVIRLDQAFTEDAFADALLAHRAVHIASHFVLDPAQGLHSHLLLGDGSRLTLDRLRDLSFDFHEVELMTLSACETAMGGGHENGREFEGFGALVQQRGAKAVIASLWPVADRSTAVLMTQFYRARQQGLSKAAALRAAQLALLQGAGGYAHPYHWAPFVLMGNWL